jgi:hypothetical protein
VIERWLDPFPEWVVFLLTIALVMLAVSIGYRRGLRVYRADPKEPEAPVGSVVGAVLGLLAFILAFTYGIAASRFDTRKQLLLDEVNALETASRRARLVSEPHRSEAIRLIQRYVDLRVETIGHPARVAPRIPEAQEILDRLSSHAEVNARADLNSDIGALFVESVDDVVRLNNSRFVVVLQYRIPMLVWWGLIFVTLCSMWGVGYQFGLRGSRNLRVHLLLAFTFSAVVTLIVILDRPFGALPVNQRPMIDLQQRLRRAPHAVAPTDAGLGAPGSAAGLGITPSPTAP